MIGQRWINIFVKSLIILSLEHFIRSLKSNYLNILIIN